MTIVPLSGNGATAGHIDLVIETSVRFARRTPRRRASDLYAVETRHQSNGF